MKKILGKLIALGVLCLSAQGAQAEVELLSAKFAGGCTVAATGSCTIKVTARGSDLGGQGVQLQRADTSNGRYRYVSKSIKTLSDSGRASFRVKNQPGCYRVLTAPNRNDVPDIRSRAICEK